MFTTRAWMFSPASAAMKHAEHRPHRKNRDVFAFATMHCCAPVPKGIFASSSTGIGERPKRMLAGAKN
jgi:hypothetical protein